MICRPLTCRENRKITYKLYLNQHVGVAYYPYDYVQKVLKLTSTSNSKKSQSKTCYVEIA